MKINMKELKDTCVNGNIVTVCDNGATSRIDMLMNSPEDAFRKAFGSKNMMVKETEKTL